MDLDQITPLILAFNESANIARTLEPLHWARRIVLLDSISADDTTAVARRFVNVSIHEHAFESHTEQWNYGISLVQTDWVLALDADYVTNREFAAELERLSILPGTNAFFARFIYCIFGRPLRASLYPPRAVLFRRENACYIPDGHTQLLQFDGKPGHLGVPIHHDDRKPLEQWLHAQDRYARLEAEKLAAGAAGLRDSVRRWIFFAPLLTPLYCLFFKGLILDGWAGWHYTFQRTLAEMILSLRLIEQKLVTKTTETS
jgi:glycosyltransferase involved in cell wall biosynthesis